MDVSGTFTPGLEPGQPAPFFELANQYGESITLHQLLTHTDTGHSQRALLVVFYPYAFTNVCAGELAELQDNQAAFESAGVRVVAISVDSSFALKEFSYQHGYEFDLLSDFWPHGGVARQFGVLDQGLGISWRVSFLIDSTGVITHRFASPLDQPRNVNEYLEAVNL